MPVSKNVRKKPKKAKTKTQAQQNPTTSMAIDLRRVQRGIEGMFDQVGKMAMFIQSHNELVAVGKTDEIVEEMTALSNVTVELREEYTQVCAQIPDKDSEIARQMDLNKQGGMVKAMNVHALLSEFQEKMTNTAMVHVGVLTELMKDAMDTYKANKKEETPS